MSKPAKITFVPDDDIRALADALSLDAHQLATTRDTARTSSAPGAVALGRRLACQVCGHSNPDDANFCSNCGIQVSAHVECPACGRLNESPANFCTHCGRPLRGRLEPRARADAVTAVWLQEFALPGEALGPGADLDPALASVVPGLHDLGDILEGSYFAAAKDSRMTTEERSGAGGHVHAGPIRITIEIDRPRVGVGKAGGHMRGAVREALDQPA